MIQSKEPDATLIQYLDSHIVPMYDSFDGGHSRDHVLYVMAESMRMASFYDVDRSMVLASAAYHDTGLGIDRRTHHLESGRIVRSDGNLSNWFTSDQIEIMAQAVEDHRASSDHEPRSIYGRLVAEADRQIIPQVVVSRAVRYGLEHCPGQDQWQRFLDHMHEKYDFGGYLKLWIPESKNAQGLAALRELIHDEKRLRKLFDEQSMCNGDCPH